MRCMRGAGNWEQRGAKLDGRTFLGGSNVSGVGVGGMGVLGKGEWGWVEVSGVFGGGWRWVE